MFAVKFSPILKSCRLHYCCRAITRWAEENTNYPEKGGARWKTAVIALPDLNRGMFSVTFPLAERVGIKCYRMQYELSRGLDNARKEVGPVLHQVEQPQQEEHIKVKVKHLLPGAKYMSGIRKRNIRHHFLLFLERPSFMKPRFQA